MAYMQGVFKPKNPKKYRYDLQKNKRSGGKEIVYRSAWELSFLMKLDADPDVLEYCAECVIIPYTDKATGNLNRYFPDMMVVKKMPDNSVRTFIIEIKPAAQTKAPKRPTSKKSKTYIKEVFTYGKNLGKWEAAERYCALKGWTFQILTEKELGQWS